MCGDSESGINFVSNMFKKTAPCFSLLIRAIHTDGLKIGILGVPFDKGQPRIGVANGPKSIREHGLMDKLLSIRE